jgi:hypothetical protein
VLYVCKGFRLQPESLNRGFFGAQVRKVSYDPACGERGPALQGFFA